MNSRPNYGTARGDAGFTWTVSAGQGAVRSMAGIDIREFNLDPNACIESFRLGCPLVRELFGEEVQLPSPGTPAISYGHVDGLGTELIFPEGGEVGIKPLYSSLDEGIAALREPVDFARAGMAPFYTDFQRQLSEAFAGAPVSFNYSLEGPITTAWELRGSDFFLDVYDEPEKAHRFLGLVTDSIVDFGRFHNKMNRAPEFSPNGCGVADDIAAMIPPGKWEEFVVPYLERYFSGRTSGVRSAHIEDLTRDHLHHLEAVGLSMYDPSISPKLSPKAVRDGCQVPFSWRLGGFCYRDMTAQDVEDFVYQAVTCGASRVYTVIEECMCDDHTAEKVGAFIRAAKSAAEMLAAGADRSELSR